jgi:hypothetical protein
MNLLAHILAVIVWTAFAGVVLFLVVLVPWWATLGAVAAIAAAWPAHKRWLRSEAAHREYMRKL